MVPDSEAARKIPRAARKITSSPEGFGELCTGCLKIKPGAQGRSSNNGTLNSFKRTRVSSSSHSEGGTKGRMESFVVRRVARDLTAGTADIPPNIQSWVQQAKTHGLTEMAEEDLVEPPPARAPAIEHQQNSTPASTPKGGGKGAALLGRRAERSGRERRTGSELSPWRGTTRSRGRTRRSCSPNSRRW